MPIDQTEKPFHERDLEDLRRFLANERELEFVVYVVDHARHAALDFAGDVGRAWDLLKSFRRSKARKRCAEDDDRPKPPRGYGRETRAGLKAWIRELRRRSGVTFALAWRLPGDAQPSLAHSADMSRQQALWECADILDYYS